VFTTASTPTGLTASAAPGSTIQLSWNDVPDDAGYKIQRSLDGTSNWIAVGATGANVITFSDTGLTSGITYYYRVFATNGGGDSSPSNVASATST
jgi:titin